MKIELTTFAKRHFDPKFGGTKILDMSPEEFIDTVNLETKYGHLLDGYAPFCKLLVVENFTQCKTGTMPITLENMQYLRTGYSARRDSELPVLSRWFEVPSKFIPKAEYLVIVLYTRQQLLEEHASNLSASEIVPEFELSDDTEYGVVAILGQIHDEEEPMTPITMVRNALGKEEGGSGHPIDKEAYDKSVEFWENNATIK